MIAPAPIFTSVNCVLTVCSLCVHCVFTVCALRALLILRQVLVMGSPQIQFLGNLSTCGYFIFFVRPSVFGALFLCISHFLMLTN